jgi:hypothetical protein
MWGKFKQDPVMKLQEKHAALLAEAHRLSTIDRSKSDAKVAEAAAVEEELIQLMKSQP